jgi:CBS domain containing-hemolysin-like protein
MSGSGGGGRVRMTRAMKIMGTISKIAVIVLVLLLSAIALFEMVVLPWGILVKRDYFWAVSLGSALCVFMCSCAEISISETKEDDINKWVKRKPPSGRRKFIENYARVVTGHRDLFNAVVILANTAILVVYMTIITPGYIDNSNNEPAILSIYHVIRIDTHIGQSNAFTGIGITLALFLLAELIPKQIAIKDGMTSVIGTSWWVILISIPLFIPAYGVATPVRWLLNRNPRKKPKN